MKKSLNVLMVVMAFSMVFIPGLNAAEIITQDVIVGKILTSVDFIRNADNFIILFSSAGAMKAELPGTGQSQLAVAKQILREKNALLPDLGYNAGLFLYTPFKEIYSMKRYDRGRFEMAIDQLPDEAKGSTDLKRGLHHMRKIIGKLQGKTVVFVFTDGTTDPFQDVGKRPEVIAKDIAAKNDVCFYVVSSATGDKEKNVLKAVASINTCSRVIPLQALYGRPEYFTGALFDIVETSVVKLTKAQKVVGFIMDDILFDFDSSVVPAEYKVKLDTLGGFLQNNPDAYIVIDGYTDNVGHREVNLWMSMRRAESIAVYLVKNFDIDPFRIVPHWYGETNPTADNSTADGRRLNRRAEIAVGGL